MKVTIHLGSHQEGVSLYFWHNHSYRRFNRQIWPVRQDAFGWVFEVDAALSSFHFCFHTPAGNRGPERFFSNYLGDEVWCQSDRSEVYPVQPAAVKGHVNEFYEELTDLVPEGLFLPETDISYLREGIPPRNSGGSGIIKTLLGGHRLNDGSLLFGLFHPVAARVYVVGNFNDWQCPGHPMPDPSRFIPLDLYRGYYDQPNLWLGRYLPPSGREPEVWEYQFFVVGGVPLAENRRPFKYVTDPFTRSYGADFVKNYSLVVDPSRFHWQATDWRTPDLASLIIYELNVYGFTEGDPDIPLEEQGKFAGIIRRIRAGYFERLGVNALELMPTSEAPSLQGPTTLGYDPCGFAAIERDFGTPDQFRELVDVAHQHGLAVLLDLMFNHTSNSFNPLWEIIDIGTPGGFYFSGSTPWGNRIATEREEVQNYLIDICKLLLTEYRVDGFRFDATHSGWMDHRFLQRLEYEIRGRGFKPDCILIAENLPNETDLNNEGWNGFAQWCDPFHDKIKALTREGVYQDWTNDSPSHLGTIFYYCRDFYAAHTNNVINYCESHDENSIPFEVGTDGFFLQTSAAQERKARLALMATMVALGQPMIYMGQEFNLYRERNRVQFEWPKNLEDHAFFQWVSGLIHLRRNLAGLRMAGSDFIGEGRFQFIIGPWLPEGRDHAVIGWVAVPTAAAQDRLVVMLNFEPYNVTVGVNFGRAGTWVKRADLNGIYPEDFESDRIRTDGYFPEFILPSSSGFIYQWIHG